MTFIFAGCKVVCSCVEGLLVDSVQQDQACYMATTCALEVGTDSYVIAKDCQSTLYIILTWTMFQVEVLLTTHIVFVINSCE